MNFLRQLSILLFIPFYLIGGGLASDYISSMLGFWNHYVYACIFPILGLLSTWVIAPYDKVYHVLLVYILGMIIAFLFAFPSSYPEGHELAYMSTYKPFIFSLLWGLLITGLIAIYEGSKSPRKP